MEYLVLGIAINWLSPHLLVWVFYLLPAWALGWIRHDGFRMGIVSVFVVRMECKNWYTRAWRDWAGFGAGSAIVLREDPDENERYARTVKHELRHCLQILLLGLLQPISYVFFLIGGWFIAKNWNPRHHPYYDNPYERDARRAAGQQVDIPRERWFQGRDDYWPWW